MAEVLDYIQFVLAPQVVTGLAFGVAVILVAIGLTIIFGLLDVINMSHGEFYAFGAFTTQSFQITIPAGVEKTGYFGNSALLNISFLDVGQYLDRACFFFDVV